MSYFAELDEGGIVQRVVVADDPAWLAERLGGEWLECADPYTDEPQEVVYPGIGWGCDMDAPQRFAPPFHDEMLEPAEDGKVHLPEAVWRNGRIYTPDPDSPPVKAPTARTNGWKRPKISPVDPLGATGDPIL